MAHIIEIQRPGKEVCGDSGAAASVSPICDYHCMNATTLTLYLYQGGPMNSSAYATYKQYLKETNDVGAAANLTLADANQTLADMMQRTLDAGAKPEPPAVGMLNLKQAASYLGYSAEGLREIVNRSKRKQAGFHILNPTIEFSQAGKRAHNPFPPRVARPLHREEPHRP